MFVAENFSAGVDRFLVERLGAAWTCLIGVEVGASHLGVGADLRRRECDVHAHGRGS